VTFDASKGMNWGALFRFDPSFVDLPISFGCIIHIFVWCNSIFLQSMKEFWFNTTISNPIFKLESLFCKWVASKILNRVIWPVIFQKGKSTNKKLEFRGYGQRGCRLGKRLHRWMVNSTIVSDRHKREVYEIKNPFSLVFKMKKLILISWF